jgi:CheY-like chemotaxis protein
VSALVLVATDVGPYQIDLVRRTLETCGHTVILARSPEQALDRLREGGLDCVVIGFERPDDAERLAGKIGRLPDPPPFVLLSGSVDAPTQSARLGAAAFVPVPLTPDDLSSAVAQVTDLKPVHVDEEPTGPLSRSD